MLRSAAIHRCTAAVDLKTRDHAGRSPYPPHERCEQTMGNPKKWVAGVALVGTLASIVAAAMLWLVITRPDAVASTLGAWLGAK